MGSRKKKRVKQKDSPLMQMYKASGIHEKIAFKAQIWWYGRHRYQLSEVFKFGVWKNIGPIGYKNAVENGYGLLHWLS